MRHRREQGWSRWEALVVIAVVVVAGILYGPLQMAREKTRRTDCAGNLKQIGLSLLLYAGDFDQYFPADESDHGQNAYLRIVTIHNWWTDRKFHLCPSARHLPWSTECSYGDRRYPTTYRYVGSGLRDDVPEAKSVSLAFDQSNNHPRNRWMNVLFADGHVEGARPGSTPTHQNGPPQ